MNIPKKAISFLLQLIAITVIFGVTYIVFGTNYLQKVFNISLLDNYIAITIFLSFVAVCIAIHLIRIKLVIWRIFLQTFLSIKSKIYLFFAHGYIVRIVALLFAFGCAIKILVFLCLINVHLDQYIGLYIAFIIFWIFRIRQIYGGSASFLRDDVSSLLKAYLMPFLVATALGVCLSFWEIYRIDNIPEIKNLYDALEMTIQTIDPNNNLYWRPLRVLIRHVYAYELLVQQMVQFKPLGTAFYFVYLVISEGAITFFGIMLLGMPIRRVGKLTKLAWQ